MDHQAQQPLLKWNRAHKQNKLMAMAGPTHHFDVNVQYTAGKNTPLTEY